MLFVITCTLYQFHCCRGTINSTYTPLAGFTLLLLDLEGDRRQTKSDASDEDERENKAQSTGPVSTSPPDQELLHKMFVFRFKLMQFINSIHNHFMTRVSA